MMGTVGILRRMIKDMPDDANFVIEYPVRYGRKQINGVQEEPKTIKCQVDGDQDFISGGTVGRDRNTVYIYHHY
jgi:hypothetical protein